MTKVEYIEKYGEEAWKKKVEQSKEWGRKHKEKYKLYDQTHKEQRAAYQKKYRAEKREKKLEYYKDYYRNNKEKLNSYSSEYQANNREKINTHKKEYTKTKRGRAQSLRHTYTEKDKAKGFDPSNNVTQKWIIDNIFSGQSCIYCGDNDWTHLGCDRIDNNKPHTADNIVCSCGLCNMERADKYSVEEFKQYRALHPRACDIPKAPALQLSETGALKKRTVL